MNTFAKDFPFHPESWIIATRHMTSAERGQYIDLLCFQWNYDGIPADLNEVANLIGVKNGKKLSPKLIEKFPISDDGKRRNPRLELERKRQLTRLKNVRDRVDLMNSSRRNEVNSESELSEVNSETINSDTSCRASSVLSTHNSVLSGDKSPENTCVNSSPKPRRGRKAKSDAETPPDVLELYDAYPRKKNRDKAIPAITSALQRASKETILAALARDKLAWIRDATDERFIPYPASWFNASPWQDGGFDLDGFDEPAPPAKPHVEVPDEDREEMAAAMRLRFEEDGE